MIELHVYYQVPNPGLVRRAMALRFRFGIRLLQLYFIFGLIALAGVWFFYSQFMLLRLSRLWNAYATTLSGQLESETQLRTRIYAKFMRRAAEPSVGSSPELDIIFDEVIEKLDFPVIITDASGRPVSYRNLEGTDTTEAGLAQMIELLDKEHEPIPVVLREADSLRPLNVIHYGLSPSTVTLRNINASLAGSVRALRLFSLFQLLLLFGFIVVGLWGILVYKRREQEHIWTALAKETAHQLATPLSSFSAWLEMLRSGAQPEVLAEMEEDLARMREVLDRFSRIGLPPKLTERPVAELIRHSVRFVQRRAPQTIRFVTEIISDLPVMVDEVLFSWMLENLLKNSVDAIGAKEGEIGIRVRTTADNRLLEIEVSDTGEGVKVDKLFEPGTTTKKYGWGVGLTLAKRIVENYHGGRLVLKESKPGRTVFSIYLPVAGNRTRRSVLT
ncbi:MAG: HAMP domain-containing sensor histidine kinase [candidate division WOR-3 bacterium]